MQLIAAFGRNGIDTTRALGRSLLLFLSALTARPQRWRGEFHRLVAQLYFIGVNSVLIVMLSGFFIGMVLALQGYTVLSRFGAEEALGQLVSLALIRELGPVVAGLLFAGRAGSAITAELGFMKATEQQTFTVDLSGLEDFNSAVLPFMLECKRIAQRQNKQCRFSGCPPDLSNLLEMASLQEILEETGTPPG